MKSYKIFKMKILKEVDIICRCVLKLKHNWVKYFFIIEEQIKMRTKVIYHLLDKTSVFKLRNKLDKQNYILGQLKRLKYNR